MLATEPSEATRAIPACTGQCCAVFTLSIPGSHHAEPCSNPEHGFVASMLEPITLPDAIARLTELSMQPLPGLEDAAELWTCRHWDAEANRCREYDQRPGFCRTFPLPDYPVCPYCGGS